MSVRNSAYSDMATLVRGEFFLLTNAPIHEFKNVATLRREPAALFILVNGRVIFQGLDKHADFQLEKCGFVLICADL